MRICSLALLLALGGCSTVRTMYVQTYCLTQQQYDDLKAKEPPKVRNQLTGQADRDLEIVAGNDVRLRAWGDGLLTILDGCKGSP